MIKKLPLILIGLAFLAGLAGLMLRRSGGGEARSIVIAKGASLTSVLRNLEKEGVLQHPKELRLWMRLSSKPLIVHPGVYTFKTNQAPRDILKTLQKGPPPVRVTIPEGWTSRQIAEALEQHGITTQADFLAVVSSESLEGFLFPDTYVFSQQSSPSVVVSAMRKRFDAVAPKDLAAQAQARKLTVRDLVTLASLVEKEARVPQERPIIAGVFYNRLKKNWRLESCATVQYALGKWKKRLLFKDLEIDSPYNTYRHRGLPPGPIANPGAGSLDAVAHPAVTDALFFVADGEGTHRFSRYYREHLDAAKLQKK